MYVWGDINIYAVSYLRLYYEPDLLLSDIFLGIPIQMVIGSILMPFRSSIAYHLTPRWWAALYLGPCF